MFEKMGIPQVINILDIGDLYCFVGNKSNLIGYIPLDVTIMGKSLTKNFLLMDYKIPYNAN